MAFWDYRLAATHNVALVSLVNIESITPTGDRAFKAPKAYGLQNPGMPEKRGDGTIYLRGYASVAWRFDALTWKQYEYLKSTYCAGGLSGKVTIYTRTNITTPTYTRYNAILELPKLADTDSEYFGSKQIDVLMSRLTTPS